MRKFTIITNLATDQRGESMISVIIALGILGIVIASASAAFNNIYAERRQIQASSAHRDVEDALVQQATKAIRQYVSSSCTQAARTANIQTIGIAGLGNLNLTQNVQSQVTLTGVNMNRFNTAARRCTNNSADMKSSPAYSRIYACYQIALSPSFTANSDKNSFASNKGAFIEVLGTLKDFRTDSPINCAQFNAADSAHSLEVYYSIHWILNNNKGYIFKTNLGTANVAM